MTYQLNNNEAGEVVGSSGILDIFRTWRLQTLLTDVGYKRKGTFKDDPKALSLDTGQNGAVLCCAEKLERESGLGCSVRENPLVLKFLSLRHAFTIQMEIKPDI